MKTRNKEPAERAITYAALLGGLTLRQARKLLRDAGFEPVNKSSWDIMKRVYAPVFEHDLTLMGESIFRPRSMSNLGDIPKKQESAPKKPRKKSVLKTAKK